MNPKDISIKDNIYILAVPEAGRRRDKLEHGEAFRRFVELFGEKFDVLKGSIDSFPQIVDIDDCPAELLPFLGSLIGFEYDYAVDVDVQRSQMKTLIHVYRKKGIPSSILDVVYKYDPQAIIFEPHTKMMRFNVSKYSGDHHLPNRTFWNTGVFEIQLDSTVNPEDVWAEIAHLRPAGFKMWIKCQDNPSYTKETEGGL